MVKMSNVLKECDIRNVLNILTSGLPKKKYSKMLEQYYSLYCMVISSWFPDGSQEMIITSYKQVKDKSEMNNYCFFGIFDYKQGIKMNEEMIDWTNVFSKDIEVFIPECLLENIDDDLLIVGVLRQLGNNISKEIQRYCNKSLFANICAMNTGEKNKVQAVEKILEQQLYYHCDKRRVANALIEHEEKKGLIVKWGDVLNEIDEEFIERASLMKDSKEMLFCHLVAGNLPSVYEMFHMMDVDNPPDLTRCYSRKASLLIGFNEVELSDYQDVIDEHLRIICETNPTYKKYPLIYVRDKFGKTYDLIDIPVFRLLCMDIFVTDSSIKDPIQVLAIILFYLEYPLRVSRIQKEYMIMSLLGMKCLHMSKDEKSQ